MNTLMNTSASHSCTCSLALNVANVFLFVTAAVTSLYMVFVCSLAWHPCTWHRSWVTWTSLCSYCSPGRIQTTRLWGVKRHYISPHAPIRQTSSECYFGMARTSTPRLGYFNDIYFTEVRNHGSFTGKLTINVQFREFCLLLLEFS